ncbi:hypothetical protein ACRALDRAFT_211211 [Sodiomyces alcalophilus JCM 7366]|uniref:uncharacterized protein n=1 Tax=Sodiomyces alcalophilus JCM 7366 TaxID=591952 RepID=UPI0039B4F2C7
MTVTNFSSVVALDKMTPDQVLLWVIPMGRRVLGNQDMRCQALSDLITLHLDSGKQKARHKGKRVVRSRPAVESTLDQMGNPIRESGEVYDVLLRTEHCCAASLGANKLPSPTGADLRYLTRIRQTCVRVTDKSGKDRETPSIFILDIECVCLKYKVKKGSSQVGEHMGRANGCHVTGQELFANFCVAVLRMRLILVHSNRIDIQVEKWDFFNASFSNGTNARKSRFLCSVNLTSTVLLASALLLYGYRRCKTSFSLIPVESTLPRPIACGRFPIVFAAQQLLIFPTSLHSIGPSRYLPIDHVHTICSDVIPRKSHPDDLTALYPPLLTVMVVLVLVHRTNLGMSNPSTDAQRQLQHNKRPTIDMAKHGAGCQKGQANIASTCQQQSPNRHRHPMCQQDPSCFSLFSPMNLPHHRPARFANNPTKTIPFSPPNPARSAGI